MKRLIPARIPPAGVLSLAWLTITAALLGLCLLMIRNQLIGMMEIQTQDDANLMAATVAPHAQEQNALYIRTLLNAIAESGDYAEVTFTSVTSGETGKRLPLYLPDVPAWFQQVFMIEPPLAIAEVRTGWDLAGHITVSRQSSTGYRLLWRTAVAMSGLSLAGLALALWGLAWLQTRQSRQQRERDELIQELEHTITLLKKRAEAKPQIAKAEVRARQIGPQRSPQSLEEVDH